VEDEDAEIDYDSDGYPIIPERSKVIDPLPAIDHSAVSVLCSLGCDGARGGRVFCSGWVVWDVTEQRGHFS